MNNDKKYFPKGLFYRESHPNSPDFVKGQVSVKVEEFKQYLGNVKGEWLNIDLKISKEGKPYAEVNTFKPHKSKGNFQDQRAQKNPTYGKSDEIPDGLGDPGDMPF